jgi:hypothetical protein
MKKATLILDHKNGHFSKYQLIQDGNDLPIAYHEETPDKLIEELEAARKTRSKIKIYLGDPKTGKSWNEEHDTTGTIGLSRGHQARYPLLIATSRSTGGGTLMDDRILKLKVEGRTVYTHPLFKQSKFEIIKAREQENILGYTHSLLIDGTLYSNHKSERSAKLLLTKLS